MDEILVESAEAISMFCRLNMANRKNIPIRSSEMGLIILVVKNEKPVTSVMAADFFKVTKPQITTMVASLSKQGYLIKIRLESDKRSFILKPTEKALSLVNDTYQEYYRVMELLKNRLGMDRFENMVSLLEEANDIMLEDKNHG